MRADALPAAAPTPRRFGSRQMLSIYIGVFVVFMLAPLVVVIGASLEPRELLRFPPHGLSLRWYSEAWNSTLFLTAAKNSLIVAVFATLGALFLGVPAAYALARRNFPGREFVSGFLNSPLLVPELVMGLAILQILAVLGVANSLATLTLGHILICLPYVVRTMHAAILGIDPQVEEAAQSLGAGRLRVTTTVVLPIVRPALFASLLFAFLMSFDNAVISLFLVSGRASTLPIQIYNYVEYSLDPTVAAISTVLMLISVAALLIASRLVPMERLK